MQWKHSNQQQVTLRNVDYDAAGFYLCEVSTDTPIFTKESNEEEVHVICEYRAIDARETVVIFLTMLRILAPQTGPPKIQFSKRQFYIGENLVANCTTSKARPPPHITWLINGKKVNIRKLFLVSAAHAGPHFKQNNGGGVFRLIDYRE